MRAELFTTSAKPADRFDTLRDLAHRLVHMAKDPNTGAQLDLVCIPGAISTARGKDDAETRPCAIVKVLRDQAKDTLGYAVLGVPPLQGPVAARMLTDMLVVLFQEACERAAAIGLPKPGRADALELEPWAASGREGDSPTSAAPARRAAR